MKNTFVALIAVATGLVGARASVQNLNNYENSNSIASLVVSSSGGGKPGAATTNKTIAQPFSVSTNAVKVPVVTLFGTNNPTALRITIYANTNVAVSLPPPAIGTYLQPTPDLSKPVATFLPPIVTSYADEVATANQPSTVYYYSTFKARLTNNTLPATTSPYWIVATLAAKGSVELEAVAADSNISTPYIGAVSTNTAISNGTLQPAPVYKTAEPTRAAAMSISFKSVK